MRGYFFEVFVVYCRSKWIYMLGGVLCNLPLVRSLNQPIQHCANKTHYTTSLVSMDITPRHHSQPPPNVTIFPQKIPPTFPPIQPSQLSFSPPPLSTDSYTHHTLTPPRPTNHLIINEKINEASTTKKHIHSIPNKNSVYS